jgi:hypothetical protein
MDQYISALVLLNLMLGQSAATSPIHKLSPDAVVRTLNEIAHGVYSPSRHFHSGEPRHPFRMERQELVATEMYTVVVLNSTTHASDFVSVSTGGVIFEDPAWAVFAAEGIAQGRKLAVPLAAKDQDLWERRARIEEAVIASRYSTADFFGPITGFVDPPTPSFRLLQVTGAELAALRARGIQSFGKPAPKFYVLFQPPAEHH